MENNKLRLFHKSGNFRGNEEDPDLTFVLGNTKKKSNTPLASKIKSATLYKKLIELLAVRR